MSYLAAITIAHTALSVLALVAGVAAIFELIHLASFGWQRSFFRLATATSISGFFFPFKGMTPAVVTGIVALIILATVFLARERRDLSGKWRWIYAAGIVSSEYLLVFVAIVQAFLKIPALSAVAPTQSEMPFLAAHLTAIAAFIVIGCLAVVRFRPKPSQG